MDKNWYPFRYKQYTTMKCSFYANEQVDLFALATQQNDMFLNLNEQEQFIFLLSPPNMCFYLARTCHNILVQRRVFIQMINVFITIYYCQKIGVNICKYYLSY